MDLPFRECFFHLQQKQSRKRSHGLDPICLMSPRSKTVHRQVLEWATRDWLRGGVSNFQPMSGFVQLLKINSQNRHEMGHQSSACAQQFQRTKKLTADSLRFANNVHLRERFNHGPNSRGSANGWRKVASKSTSTHAFLPAMSSVALETRAVTFANLI